MSQSLGMTCTERYQTYLELIRTDNVSVIFPWFEKSAFTLLCGDWRENMKGDRHLTEHLSLWTCDDDKSGRLICLRACSISVVWMSSEVKCVFIGSLCAAERVESRQYKGIHWSLRWSWKHLLPDADLQPWHCSGKSAPVLHNRSFTHFTLYWVSVS